MKRHFSLAMAFCLFISQNVFAFQYLELRPEAIQALKSQGLGAVYNVKGSDGSIRRMRLVSYAPASHQHGLHVKMEPADNIILMDFASDDEFTFRPVAPAPSPLKAPSGSGTDLSFGLTRGLLAGVQVGIIESSGAQRRIDAAYARIDELERQMGEDFKSIEDAQVDLRRKAVLVTLKASNAPLALPAIAPQHNPSLGERLQWIFRKIDGSNGPIDFVSRDPKFVNEARAIEQSLSHAKIRDHVDQRFYALSRQALIDADRQSFLENPEDARFLLQVAQIGADVLVGLDPFTGTARSLYEAVFGENLVTGKPLEAGERALAALGVLTAGYLAYLVKTARAVQLLGVLAKKIAPATFKTFHFLRDFIIKTGNGVDLAAKKSESLRRVNLLSKVDPDWGLTRRHLNKHFFGESKYALRNIDPSGDVGRWMSQLSDLLQRPFTKTTKEGGLEIHGIFARTDGSGDYKMGVRLWPNPDGSFELITVLTKQD